MTVRSLPCLLSLSLFLALTACPAAPSDDGVSSGTGGSRPAGSGGATNTGGASSTGGTTGSGGSPGSGGSAATGGTTSSGGAGGAAAGTGGAAIDAPAAGGTSGSDTAPEVTSAADAGKTRPWLELCQPDWPLAQCCAHYCDCMAKSCPKQAPADCVTTCVGAKWNLKCRVEQCFESRNPNYVKDAASHCGHAIEKPPKCQNLVP